MTIRELYAALDARFSRALSASWDNDGLMVCADADKAVGRVLIALDATSDTIRAAGEGGFDVLLTHHPLIFSPVRALDGSDVTSRRVLLAMKLGVSVISLHTRLDCAAGGVADALCAALGMTDTTQLLDSEGLASGRLGKMPDGKLAAVAPGSGSDLVGAAIASGAKLFVTGELSYNRILDLSEIMEVATLGHYESEAPVLGALAELLKTLGIECVAHG